MDMDKVVVEAVRAYIQAGKRGLGLADAMREAVAEAVVAERERCAALCLRPAGWLSDSQQALATEIRTAILGNAKQEKK